jgi:hypothetical protein
MARYAVVNTQNMVTNIVIYDGPMPFPTQDWMVIDQDGNLVDGPYPTYPVLDTDPPTAVIFGYYRPDTNTFTPVGQP